MDPSKRNKPEMTMEEILALLEEQTDILVEVDIKQPEVGDV